MAVCFSLLGNKDEALGTQTSLSTLRFVRAQKIISRWKNITLDVEGDAAGMVQEGLRPKRCVR